MTGTIFFFVNFGGKWDRPPLWSIRQDILYVLQLLIIVQECQAVELAGRTIC